jgi:hypothetical protein
VLICSQFLQSNSRIYSPKGTTPLKYNQLMVSLIDRNVVRLSHISIRLDKRSYQLTELKGINFYHRRVKLVSHTVFTLDS